MVLGEEQVLNVDPTNGRGELVGEELNEDGVRELLTLLKSTPASGFFVPVLQDLRETRRRGLIVDELSVLLGDGEGMGDQVRDISGLEHVGVQVSGVDLLREV